MSQADLLLDKLPAAAIMRCFTSSIPFEFLSSLRNWEGVSAASLLQRAEDLEIPDGKGARLGMFSARFDRGPVEKKFRKVHEIMLKRNYSVLMVNVGPTEDFGAKTDEYLARLYKENGTLLAVCTDDYAEKTASNYSSFKELKFAHEQRLPILPLKICDTYPPEPSHGPTHPHDKSGEAFGLVRLALHPSLVYLDCRALEPAQIAAKIANHLHAKVGSRLVSLDAASAAGWRQPGLARVLRVVEKHRKEGILLSRLSGGIYTAEKPAACSCPMLAKRGSRRGEL